MSLHTEYMSEPEDDFGDYDTGDWGCPPCTYVICAYCGGDVCDDCHKHRDEEEEACPASTDT